MVEDLTLDSTSTNSSDHLFEVYRYVLRIVLLSQKLNQKPQPTEIATSKDEPNYFVLPFIDSADGFSELLQTFYDKLLSPDTLINAVKKDKQLWVWLQEFTLLVSSHSIDQLELKIQTLDDLLILFEKYQPSHLQGKEDDFGLVRGFNSVALGCKLRLIKFLLLLLKEYHDEASYYNELSQMLQARFDAMLSNEGSSETEQLLDWLDQSFGLGHAFQLEILQLDQSELNVESWLKDLKTLLYKLKADELPYHSKQEFVKEEGYQSFVRAEMQHLQGLMLGISELYPEAYLAVAMLKNDHQLFFVPNDVQFYFEILVLRCLTKDLVEDRLLHFSKFSLQLLDECSFRWRLPEHTRLISIGRVIDSQFLSKVQGIECEVYFGILYEVVTQLLQCLPEANLTLEEVSVLVQLNRSMVPKFVDNLKTMVENEQTDINTLYQNFYLVDQLIKYLPSDEQLEHISTCQTIVENLLANRYMKLRSQATTESNTNDPKILTLIGKLISRDINRSFNFSNLFHMDVVHTVVNHHLKQYFLDLSNFQMEPQHSLVDLLQLCQVQLDIEAATSNLLLTPVPFFKTHFSFYLEQYRHQTQSWVENCFKFDYFEPQHQMSFHSTSSQDFAKIFNQQFLFLKGLKFPVQLEHHLNELIQLNYEALLLYIKKLNQEYEDDLFRLDPCDLISEQKVSMAAVKLSNLYYLSTQLPDFSKLVVDDSNSQKLTYTLTLDMFDSLPDISHTLSAFDANLFVTVGLYRFNSENKLTRYFQSVGNVLIGTTNLTYSFQLPQLHPNSTLKVKLFYKPPLLKDQLLAHHTLELDSNLVNLENNFTKLQFQPQGSCIVHLVKPNCYNLQVLSLAQLKFTRALSMTFLPYFNLNWDKLFDFNHSHTTSLFNLFAINFELLNLQDQTSLLDPTLDPILQLLSVLHLTLATPLFKKVSLTIVELLFQRILVTLVPNHHLKTEKLPRLKPDKLEFTTKLIKYIKLKFHQFLDLELNSRLPADTPKLKLSWHYILNYQILEWLSSHINDSVYDWVQMVDMMDGIPYPTSQLQLLNSNYISNTNDYYMDKDRESREVDWLALKIQIVKRLIIYF